jgi:beta-phosphoglucomutase-like phosphatase (HAD superfamily)
MKLLALADRVDVPMVAVTNAPRLNAEMMLSGLGIMQRFKAVISATSFRTESRTRCHIWRGCAP